VLADTHRAAKVEAVKKSFGPPMNTDKHFVFHRRLSAFIGGD
jgi:hypothetical protein